MKSKKPRSRIRSFLRRSDAVSALEYAILVGVIAMAVGVGLNAFSVQVRGALAAIGTTIVGANLIDADGTN